MNNKCPVLRYLNLSENQITYEGMKFICERIKDGNLKSLEILNVSCIYIHFR